MTGSGIYNEQGISRVVSAWSGPVQWVCLSLYRMWMYRHNSSVSVARCDWCDIATSFLQSTVLTNPCILVVDVTLPCELAASHHCLCKWLSRCGKSRTEKIQVVPNPVLEYITKKIYNEISDLEKVSRPGTRNYIVIWTTLSYPPGAAFCTLTSTWLCVPRNE